MKPAIIFEIKLLQNSIMRMIGKDMKNQIYSPPSLIQAEIIQYLFQNQQKEMYQTELETVFELRRSTISGILKTMEKKNLIKRIDSKKDARTKQIILTQETLKIHVEILEYLKHLEQKLLSNIEEQDLAIFLKVVEQMRENIR